jgi:hypothetical protein
MTFRSRALQLTRRWEPPPVRRGAPVRGLTARPKLLTGCRPRREDWTGGPVQSSRSGMADDPRRAPYCTFAQLADLLEGKKKTWTGGLVQVFRVVLGRYIA